MTAGRGTEAVPVYSGGTTSTFQVGAAGIVQPVVNSISGVSVPPPGPDRVAEWLHSEGARQHQEHWVALDADEGRFLAVVDDLRDRRLWRARGALIIYVDPPEDES